MGVTAGAVDEDHPRSRGVYSPTGTPWPPPSGSSPLARGLPGAVSSPGALRGIIPARAGFTPARRGPRGPARDHPRSRGVYRICPTRPGPAPGSSPLARGLLPAGDHIPGERGIIPARAGFTRTTWRPRWARRGSSPLARGLLGITMRPAGHAGIIPARAGFTRPCGRRWCRPQDHPRSRGVYACESLESQRTHTLPDPCCLHCRPRVRSAELR